MISTYLFWFVKIIIFVIFFSTGVSKIMQSEHYVYRLKSSFQLFSGRSSELTTNLIKGVAILEISMAVVQIFFTQFILILVLLLSFYIFYLVINDDKKCNCGGVIDYIDLPKPLAVIRNLLLIWVCIQTWNNNHEVTILSGFYILLLSASLLLILYSYQFMKSIISNGEMR